jgi:hypothetical protein
MDFADPRVDFTGMARSRRSATMSAPLENAARASAGRPRSGFAPARIAADGGCVFLPDRAICRDPNGLSCRIYDVLGVDPDRLAKAGKSKTAAASSSTA